MSMKRILGGRSLLSDSNCIRSKYLPIHPCCVCVCACMFIPCMGDAFTQSSPRDGHLHTLAFSVSSFPPTLVMMWQRHSRLLLTSSVLWLRFFSRSCIIQRNQSDFSNYMTTIHIPNLSHDLPPIMFPNADHVTTPFNNKVLKQTRSNPASFCM